MPGAWFQSTVASHAMAGLPGRIRPRSGATRPPEPFTAWQMEQCFSPKNRTAPFSGMPITYSACRLAEGRCSRTRMVIKPAVATTAATTQRRNCLRLLSGAMRRCMHARGRGQLESVAPGNWRNTSNSFLTAETPRRRGAEEKQENQVHRGSSAVYSSPSWSAEGTETAEKMPSRLATTPAHQVYITSATSALSGFDSDLSSSRRLGVSAVKCSCRSEADPRPRAKMLKEPDESHKIRHCTRIVLIRPDT